MIQILIPLRLQAVEEELQAEVQSWVGGEHYTRSDGTCKRWGQNPGSVFLGDQKVRISVPRVRDLKASKEVRLKSYERLQDPNHVDEMALSRVINGISQGKYERAAENACQRRSGSRKAASPGNLFEPLPSDLNSFGHVICPATISS